jgi:hypothetical protein
MRRRGPWGHAIGDPDPFRSWELAGVSHTVRSDTHARRVSADRFAFKSVTFLHCPRSSPGPRSMHPPWRRAIEVFRAESRVYFHDHHALTPVPCARSRMRLLVCADPHAAVLLFPSHCARRDSSSRICSRSAATRGSECAHRPSSSASARIVAPCWSTRVKHCVGGHECVAPCRVLKQSRGQPRFPVAAALSETRS